MAAGAMDKIFHAFEQGENAITRQYGGLGLGLAISRALVEAHGGRIRAESAGLGMGSTFTIELKVATHPTAEVPTRDGEAKFLSSGKGGRKLLLVEDHPDTSATFARVLRKEGYDVQVAGSCAEAVNTFESDPEIDLVLSDLGLPDGNGFELMRQLQSIRTVKAIALSGFGMEGDVAQSRDAGFSDHLVKPIDLGQLRRALRRVDGLVLLSADK